MSTSRGIRKSRITPQQRVFIAAYMETSNAAEAARRAGYAAGRNRQASHILRQPHIAAEVARLQEEMAKKAGYTLEKAMEETNEMLELAKASRNAMAGAKLLELKMKMHGLLVEKMDHRMLGNFSVAVEGVNHQPLQIENLVHEVVAALPPASKEDDIEETQELEDPLA